METFKNTTNGFNFVFERKLEEHETVIVKMPVVSPNKRGINDIGWQTDGAVQLYGTICRDPESRDALWQEIEPCDEVNKTVSAIKVENLGGACRIIIRTILN